MTKLRSGQYSSRRLALLLVAALAAIAIACSSGNSDRQDANDGSAVSESSSGGVAATAVPEPVKPAENEPAAVPADSSNGSVTGESEPESTPTLTIEEAVEKATGDLFLDLSSPASTEMFVTQRTIEFSGRTTVDALLSVNDDVVEVDEEGLFAISVNLEEGPNVVEVIASNSIGDQLDEVILVIYEPA